MSDGWKICVIGAGSTYTPELVEGLIDSAATLSLRELALVDIDHERLEILAGMARRMFRAAGQDVAVISTEDRRRAIEGADFVLNQIRVGGQAARIADETRGRRHDLIAQETTGPGASPRRHVPFPSRYASRARSRSSHHTPGRSTSPTRPVW